MYLLGFDIGSSSVKASLIQAETGEIAGSAYFPEQEMKITAVQPGWAEQEPSLWWENLKLALALAMKRAGIQKEQVKAIGISYQMHGLVMVDKQRQPVRPSIIWCDSRATEIGNRALQEIGREKCLASLLNSPGNFTASKLKWVMDNEPGNFKKLFKIMLPGDYIAMKMTGEIFTTMSGLSEGILWDFKRNSPAEMVLENYGFDHSILPGIVPTFAEQGKLSGEAASELGLAAGTPVSYRAGDQPNNALSLNVLEPGEVATTAGTSGVVYGVSSEIKYDQASRVNTFAHVNHSNENPRLGVLLCINGTGILNAWLKKNVVSNGITYNEMNNLSASVPIGSDGLVVLPFGNGAERVLQNRDIGSSIHNLNFNIHHTGHLLRAAQEGIAFSFKYGMDIMAEIGINPSVIRAGEANLFLSPVFRETLAGITGATIELYNTDGSVGAARGAGIGAGIYSSASEAFTSLRKLQSVQPDTRNTELYLAAYRKWKEQLEKATGL